MLSMTNTRKSFPGFPRADEVYGGNPMRELRLPPPAVPGRWAAAAAARPAENLSGGGGPAVDVHKRRRRFRWKTRTKIRLSEVSTKFIKLFQMGDRGGTVIDGISLTITCGFVAIAGRVESPRSRTCHRRPGCTDGSRDFLGGEGYVSDSSDNQLAEIRNTGSASCSSSTTFCRN